MKKKLAFLKGIVKTSEVLESIPYCLLSLVELSETTTAVLTKDAVIEHSNVLQKKDIGTNLGNFESLWDAIFSMLVFDGLIVTTVYNISLTQSAVTKIETEFSA